VADCSILKESARVRPNRAPILPGIPPRVLPKGGFLLKGVLLKGGMLLFLKGGVLHFLKAGVLLFLKGFVKVPVKVPVRVLVNVLVKVEGLRLLSGHFLAPR
jgi:hypothetical protein